jgi:tricorn protease
MFRRPAVFVYLLAVSLLAASSAAAQTKLLRFPDIHGDEVAFCYAGDLWVAPAAGGTARRLTAHPGLELFPKFSPDGRWIAFTGQYDGDEQVYVIPSSGGAPKQLTFYPARGPLPPRWGYDNQVYDWTADGTSVLLRSLRDTWDLTGSKLYLVPVDGGLPEALPMPESGAGDLSPDGLRVAYSPLVRDFRTWKRYQGGWAQDLYVFDLSTHEWERITDHPRADRDPMWIGDRVYFSSDRTGTLNLFAYDLGSGQTEQLTRSDTWDVRWPSDDGERRIVYELNGELHVYDLVTRASTPISVFVPNDGVAMRPSRIAAEGNIEGWDLSPKGERALFVARGDVFTAPIEKGPTRNLTKSSNAHDKRATWSPDGKWIGFISDMDGEEEIYRVAQDGTGEPEQLTDGGTAMRYTPVWAPDGERLAFSDKDGKLYVLEIASKELVEIADEERGQIRDYAWSPHGGHLAFSMSDPTGFRSIYIWTVDGASLTRVTGTMFSEYGPAWGAEGNYLYYLSDREYAPQISNIEWNYAGDRSTGIFAMALREDVAHPFPPESDEVEIEEEKEDGTDKKSKDKDKQKKDDGEEEEEPEHEPIRIDFSGLGERVARVPVPADNYGGLTAIDGNLIYVETGPFYYGRQSDVQPSIQIFSFEDREAKTLAENVAGYAVSADGAKLLVRQNGAFQLFDAKPDAAESAKAVSTAGLQVDRVPAEEWAQIFDEVWRRYRDFFYVANMHGYDWKALGDRYRPLLEHVAHRSDLNYVIGEMIAELNVGHAYITGGDYDIPERPRVALPGARFELDRDADRYRIVEIFEGQNEEDRYRSPLTEVGVDVRVGDYLLAIDGTEVRGKDNPYRMLQHIANRPVELTVNEQATSDGARKATYSPITTETSLLYLEMVTSNRAKVDEATGGRVGYIHIPDMGTDGIREFIKWYYPQIRKEGMVVDVRNNGGGNVSQMLIERLRRELLGTRFGRTSDTPGTYPATVFHGHLACILDEDSASDGDIFPHMFRQAGLGPLIGKRSWGGVVGIRGHGTLIDGGGVNVPEQGTNALDGSWIIEGHGVEPDIEVTNDPKAVLEGRDPQLERAVEEVLRRVREEPRRLPDRPADPVKTP